MIMRYSTQVEKVLVLVVLSSHMALVMIGWLTVYYSYRKGLIEVAFCILRLYEANNT